MKKDNNGSPNEELVLTEIQKNEYSIYDYFKKNPSICIAFFSATAAIITFFARFLTIISVRKELLFWEFDPSYFTISNESVLFTAIVSIIYVIIMIVSAVWFSETCEAYLPFKKYNLAVHYSKKILKDLIMRIKKENKNNQSIAAEMDDSRYYKNFYKAIFREKMFIQIYFLFNVLPIILLIFVGCFILAIATITDNYSNIWLVVITSFIIHIFVLLFISKIFFSKNINKKDIKQKCIDLNATEAKIEGLDFEKFPIRKFFTNGFRSVLKNSTIVIIVVTLLINCVALCISNSVIEKDLTKSIKYLRITIIDDMQYALLYQNGNQYFLEEIFINNPDEVDNSEYSLTIYTNRQRIITTNDILISVYQCNEIRKEHKIEENKHSQVIE